MDNEKEISFGAYDSELMRQEIYIPEGFEATIEGNRIILTRIENDDEKVRKWLIDTLKGYHHLFEEGGVTKEDMLAWLEKKGEQKPNANCLLRWSKEDEKMFQSLEDIVGDYWAKAEQEKNEIKIREASDVSYFLKTIQKSPLCWIKCSDGLPNKDGTYLVVTDGTHNDVYDLARYDSIDGWHKASEIIYWMPIPQLNNKSIIEQKSAEWSEEDEKIKEDILYDLNTLLEGNKSEWAIKDLKKEINWLKSLKERYIWKPSEEQVHAFEQVYDWYNNNFAPSETLTSLYKDLEKLKGE